MKSVFHKLICACFFVLSCFSCDNNNDTVPQDTITFTINNEYQKYWIVLSDASGKVLTWKALTNGVKETFTYPSEEEVMLTIIARSTNMTNTTIQSYGAVKAGDYSMTFDYSSFANTGTEGKYVINIDNPDQFYIVSAQSEGSCGISDLYSDPTRMNLNLCDDSNNLLITCVSKEDDGTPRYMYKENLSKNGSITLDRNLFNQLPVMKAKIVTFDKPVISGYSLMEGRTVKKKQTFLLPSYFPSNNNLTKLKIYYPDLAGTLFSDYTTTIGFTREKYVEHFVTKGAAEPPASSYEGLDVNWSFADSVKISTESISAHVSGQADYIFTAFNYYDTNNTVWWFLHAPFANDFSINPPRFPDDLKTSAKLELVSKVVRTQINFIEDKGLGGYEGFYKAELNQNTTVPRSLPFDRRSKVYRINRSVYVGTYSRVGYSPASHR